MYQTEIDKFSEKIDGQNIRTEAKKALHDVVDEFFSVDYHNISEERKRKIEESFEIRRLECKIFCTTFDVAEVEGILNQIENNLFTILDQSVDKSRKSLLEKILSNFHPIQIHK
jgi:hypothetical protein